MCYKIVRLICKFTVDDREDEQEGVQPLCMYVCITFISDSAIQNNIVIQCWGP